ncbi:hypothetical protein QQ045_009385 [Rhodiola kirilowii]
MAGKSSAAAESLSNKEREIGLIQDLLIPVTNFHNEDEGFMILPGDVFDLPIRKDIVHRVVRWQLAKRQQLGNPFNQIYQKGCIVHGPKPHSHAFKVNVLPSIRLNVYSILQYDTQVMSRDAINRIVEADAHSNQSLRNKSARTDLL